MAKKQTKSEGRENVPVAEDVIVKSGRKQKALGIWVPPELHKAFHDFLDSLEFPSSISAVGQQAIEEFLEKRGFWTHRSTSR